MHFHFYIPPQQTNRFAMSRQCEQVGLYTHLPPSFIPLAIAYDPQIEELYFCPYFGIILCLTPEQNDNEQNKAELFLFKRCSKQQFVMSNGSRRLWLGRE